MKQLWTYKDLSEHLKMSENTLRQYVMYRKIPFIKIGKSVRFDPDVMVEWIKDQTFRDENENIILDENLF